jgi:polyisoprenoid-binding protein YceI
MRSVLQFSVGALCGVLALACQKAPKGDQAVISNQVLPMSGDGDVFNVDTASSWIRFTGHGVGKNHTGTFRLQYGAVDVEDDQLTEGTFVIDISSLDPEEEGEVFDTKLRPHLLSGDFFDAANFGTSRFEITGVAPFESGEQDKSLVEGANFLISGNLQIKEVTRNITFPARVEMKGERLEARANFDIDRRQWEMNYGNDKTLGDKFISETVNIELFLAALRDKQAIEVNPF